MAGLGWLTQNFPSSFQILSIPFTKKQRSQARRDRAVETLTRHVVSLLTSLLNDFPSQNSWIIWTDSTTEIKD